MSVIDIRQGATQNDRAETSWPEARPAPLPCGAPSSDRFRKLATTAAEMINASIAFVTVLGRNAHSINGRLGFHLRGSAIERVVNLHHLAMGGKLVINDLSKDGRTQNLPCVTDFPCLRFYAGVPIIVGGRTVGTLAVTDRSPRPDGRCLHESAALSGFAACASRLWDNLSGNVSATLPVPRP